MGEAGFGAPVGSRRYLGALLRELREAHQSLAVVVNEYGGTEGLVTVEDEYDLPDDTITWQGEHSAEVAGSMTIDDFNESTGTALRQDRARTLAGLVFTRLGRRPAIGDEIDADGVRLRVDALRDARITRLSVVLPEAPGRPPDGEAVEREPRLRNEAVT